MSEHTFEVLFNIINTVKMTLQYNSIINFLKIAVHKNTIIVDI